MNKRRLATVLKPVVGLGLLAWLLSSIDYHELAVLMAKGDPWLLVGALFSLVTALTVGQAVRLHILVRHYTGTFGRTLRLLFIGALFNTVLPSGVGGDFVRLVYLRRLRPGPWAGPLGLLLLHRLSGVAVVLVAGGAYALVERARLVEMWGRRSFALDLDLPWLWVGVGVALVVLGASIVALRFRTKLRSKVQKTLQNFRNGLAELSGRDLWALLASTLAFHGMRMLGFWLAVRYLGFEVGWGELVLTLTVAVVVAMLPISVGGLGVIEGGIAMSLSLFGMSGSAAAAVALVNRVAMLAVGLAGGVVYATARGELGAVDENEAEP